MTSPTSRLALVLLALPPLAAALALPDEATRQDGRATDAPPADQAKAAGVRYLEIVTPDPDAVCATLEELHGLRFGEPDAGLGGARTTPLAGGGSLGVRAPMHDLEKPAVRPYFLVDDIEAAVEAAEAAGAEIAHPPLEIPDHGTFAIYFQGDAELGLWQR